MKNKLLALFNALSSDEQNIVLALAVVYAPISQSGLQGLLRATGCFEPKKIAMIDRPLREKLQNTQLLVITLDGW
ncbi:MAG TPA: hypothetical protein VIJ25_01940, partial [Methylococcales bacterium]